MKHEIKTLPAFFIVFPIIGLILQLTAIILGINGITDDPDGRIIMGSWLAIANGLVIMTIIFALVGSIKRTKGMYIIGSGVSLATGIGSIITIFVIGCYAFTDSKINPNLIALYVVSFILEDITSLLLIISSIITGAKKRGSYAFLGVSSILSFILFSVFTLAVSFILISQTTQTKVNALGYTLTNNATFLILLLSLIILSFIKHPENQIDDEHEASKPIEKPVEKKVMEELKNDSLDELRKYKQMLDENLITKEDYEKKKNELLK